MQARSQGLLGAAILFVFYCSVILTGHNMKTEKSMSQIKLFLEAVSLCFLKGSFKQIADLN